MNAKLETPPPRAAGETVKDLRRLRARRLFRRFVAVVVLPTIVSAIYLGLVATPQYESVSMFTINSADGTSGMMPALLGAVPGSGAARDIVVVREYVLSRDMLELLMRDHGFVEHYGAERIDYFSRLGADEPSEDIYDYYLDQIEVQHDELGSTLTLRVRAFSSADARRISEAILAAAEAKVNAMDEEARDDKIALAQREVDRAEARLVAARQKVLELQREGHELNPLESAGALMAVRGGLEGELAEARAELQTMLANLQPEAPQVVVARQRVAALAGQVEAQRRRMTGQREGGLGASIAEFEPIIVEKELAQAAYASAFEMLELARVEAARQHR